MTLYLLIFSGLKPPIGIGFSQERCTDNILLLIIDINIDLL